MARQPGRRCHLHGPNGPYRRFVALDQIPGFDYLVLYELFVRQAYRSRGIGAQLLREVENMAATLGYQRITLSPWPLEQDRTETQLVA